MTKTTYQLVEGIRDNASDYIMYLNDMGNECAWTDRCIENIIEKAVLLAKQTENEDLLRREISYE